MIDNRYILYWQKPLQYLGWRRRRNPTYERERERERMMSSQHGRPTKAEFLCVFFVLYRREKNAKKISVIKKKGLVTSVKISLCVAFSSYSRLWKDRGTVTPRKM